MPCEIPFLMRCCFCFPLRYGLLVWAYIKQIISLLMLTFLLLNVSLDSRHMGVVGQVTFILVIILTILDIAFHVLFIISAHTRDYKKMRIFYRYNIFVLIQDVVILFLFIVMWVYNIYLSPFVLLFLWSVIMPSLLLIILLLVCQGYLTILVRSEFLKLKNNSNFEFVNHAADEKCTANIDFVKGIPTTI